MRETVFNKVDYDLDALLKDIDLGVIGLPDIQRPFVWKNSKVRDLFDSMYRGYPVGYLLFWHSLDSGTKHIGTDSKQKAPRLVIVDGQQRLTSLYAVVKGLPVLRADYEQEHIAIAFNPLEERFEVADAAILRDPQFIPNISAVWSKESNIINVINDFLARLEESRPLEDGEREKIQDAILRLQSVTAFPLTALELNAAVSAVDAAEVFNRINSKGVRLQEADFILTLMSVFWDDGRRQLEDFCRRARIPAKGESSPFNHFIEPSPDQLLRVAVALAFRRARLKSVYSILRGKDVATDEYSDERRREQFARLEDAQERVLDLQHWHDFLACVRAAGFRSGKMLTSANNLIFAYVLYLIGRTELGVPIDKLRPAIAQWFFMSAVTGRFTGSPESAMESDLQQLRGVNEPDEFLSALNHLTKVALPPDFWAVTLPNDLASTAAWSPSLFAYNAALVLLDARALFSQTRIADLLDPTIKAKRNAAERHHLFPKNFLRSIGIKEQWKINQIANYAYVEWHDNSAISDRPPSEYVPAMTKSMSEAMVERQFRLHALPPDWTNMEYGDFLEARRELMADVVREGFERLCSGTVATDVEAEPFDILALISDGESDAAEFKSSLRRNLHTNENDKRMEHAVLKTIAGFLNNHGGTLIIGVADDGTPIGIDKDGFASEDKMSLHLINLIKDRLGNQALTRVRVHFDDHQGVRVLVVRCKPAHVPVFLKDGAGESLFVRTGPATTELPPSEIHSFVAARFSK